LISDQVTEVALDISPFEDGEDGEIAAAADVEAEEEVLFNRSR